MKIHLVGYNGVFLVAVIAAAAMLLPIDALAQDAVTKALDKGVELLTSKWARGAAIIALAVLGYGMWSGWMSKRMALGWVGGVALVFGGASIVDFFTA